MKTFKTDTVQVIDKIICNKCGLEEEREGFTGLEEVSVNGHYMSSKLTDGVKYTFSICETCLIDLFADFTHPPDEEEYNFWSF